MKSLFVVIAILICANAQAINDLRRGFLDYPGYDPVSIAFGGFRSVGFSDPVSMLTNPSTLSSKLGGIKYSVSYGPIYSDVSFNDQSGSHSDSWVESLGNGSAGIKVNIFETLAIGFAAAPTSNSQFTTAYYVPDSPAGNPLEDRMETEGGTSEAQIGVAWDAKDWVVIGGSVGIRAANQSFDITCEDPAWSITGLTYQWSEACFSAGVCFPLEHATAGLSWSSPGEFTDSKLAGGCAVFVTPDLTTGAELEVSRGNNRDIYTGRLMCSAEYFRPFVIRGGFFYSSDAPDISRQGPGFSAGLGYKIGDYMINAGYTRWHVRGTHDLYGYESLESYEGEISMFSLGGEVFGEMKPLLGR